MSVTLQEVRNLIRRIPAEDLYAPVGVLVHLCEAVQDLESNMIKELAAIRGAAPAEAGGESVEQPRVEKLEKQVTAMIKLIKPLMNDVNHLVEMTQTGATAGAGAAAPGGFAAAQAAAAGDSDEEGIPDNIPPSQVTRGATPPPPAPPVPGAGKFVPPPPGPMGPPVTSVQAAAGAPGGPVSIVTPGVAGQPPAPPKQSTANGVS